MCWNWNEKEKSKLNSLQTKLENLVKVGLFTNGGLYDHGTTSEYSSDTEEVRRVFLSNGSEKQQQKNTGDGQTRRRFLRVTVSLARHGPGVVWLILKELSRRKYIFLPFPPNLSSTHPPVSSFVSPSCFYFYSVQLVKHDGKWPPEPPAPGRFASRF